MSLPTRITISSPPDDKRYAGSDSNEPVNEAAMPRLDAPFVHPSASDPTSPNTAAPANSSCEYMQTPSALVEAFDAKTPLPSDWQLDNRDLQRALSEMAYKDAKPAPEAGVRRLQALARGFLCRKHLKRTGKQTVATSNSHSPYVPTPHKVVASALAATALTPDDCLLDLGCGDGRVCIGAVQASGCSAVGIDVSADCIAAARRTASSLPPHVRNRVRLLNSSFFEEDVIEILAKECTAVWLFLLPRVLPHIAQMVLRKARPGTLVLCYAFELRLPDYAERFITWKPEKTMTLEGSFFLPQQMSTLRTYRVTSELKEKLNSLLADSENSSMPF